MLSVHFSLPGYVYITSDMQGRIKYASHHAQGRGYHKYPKQGFINQSINQSITPETQITNPSICAIAVILFPYLLSK